MSGEDDGVNGMAAANAAVGAQRAAPRDFFTLSRDDLTQYLALSGHPRFRAEQIWSWAYRQLVASFEAMSNAPATLRRQLAAEFSLSPATVVTTLEDRPSFTRKDLLRLGDGETIEAVLMQEPTWHTVCISSQVGCAMGCTICATGQVGFRRNLTTGEIVYQVIHFARVLASQQAPCPLENVVFMGMGEPMLNYEAVMASVACLCDPYGLALSPHNITVSTVGFPQGIRALAVQPYAVRLAVSLHGADQETRQRLVPLAERIRLDELMAACREYGRLRDQRITFEYVLVAGINDREADADRLVSLIGSLPAHVNIIPLNPVNGCDFRPAGPRAIELFHTRLKRSRIPCTVRLSRGVSIGAGCGQLRGAAS